MRWQPSDSSSYEALNRRPNTNVSEDKNTEGVHYTLFIVQFMQQLAFAGTIVDSYQIGNFFDVSPAFSGLLVGLFMAGGGVGTSCMMLVLQTRPSAWKSFRAIVLGCQVMDTCAVLMYTLLLVLAVNVQLPSAWIYFLAVTRFAWGLGPGVTGQLAGVTITKVTPPHEIVEKMQSLQFWQTLGLGLGPFIAALAIFAQGALGASAPYRLCAAPAALASLQISSTFILWKLCPDSVEEWSSGGKEGTSSGPQRHSSKIQQLLFLISCFLLCALRGYAVAGAEVGTAMLLEVPYGWNRHSIGFLVSGAFLASIPLRSVYFSIKGLFSTIEWIRILSVVAMAGTLLLFSRVALIPDGLMLVGADAIMFPSLYLAEGLTRGLMLQFAKDSTVLSSNQASFLAIVLNNCARTVAPWLSRKHISTGDPAEGQDLFATGQLLSCVLFLAIFELGIRHMLDAPVLVIGLPSLNEADNIEAVTKVVDAGCRQHFPNHRCILVNADCQSSDGTSDIFAQTSTHSQKVVLRTALPAQGKGAALRLVFEYMLQVDAEFGLCLDTDVTSITPDWIKSFSLALPYDFAAPRYARHRLDGFITNLLIYPSICAVFGCDVRQGIGGDFGFSRRAAEAFLSKPWHPKVEKYGIDIFMTTTVLKKGFSIGEVELPAKVHSPSLPKLKKMFMEVAEVLLSQLQGESFSGDLQALPRVSLQLHKHQIPELKVDSAALLELAEECFQENEPRILEALAPCPSFQSALAERAVDGDTWAQLVHWALTTKASEAPDVLETLRCFFFLRAASHCGDVKHLSNPDAEEFVKKQRDHVVRLCRESGL